MQGVQITIPLAVAAVVEVTMAVVAVQVPWIMVADIPAVVAAVQVTLVVCSLVL
ncbi:hypothetical protein D3C71_1175440 [compost metagenome]